MLILYGRFPTRSNRVQWALEELQVPYTFYQIDFAAGDANSDLFLSLNPAGKIPVLQDGDLVITESGAICNYLGDKFPESGLTPPPASAARAKYDQWMFFSQAELEQPLWTKAKHRFALAKELRVKGLDKTIEWEWKRASDIFAKGLGENEFIVNDRFTMADIMLTHTLGWAKAIKLDIDHKNLVDYADRNLARPAVTRMVKTKGEPFPRERVLN